MQRIDISFSERGFRIEGFPDGKHVKQLDSVKARRLSHLALHISDFESVLECLNTLSQSKNESDSPSRITAEALWIASLIKFYKCFGRNEERFSLSAEVIYKGDSVGLDYFRHYKALRDMHIAHDESPLLQCQPCAILNNGTKAYKIEKIVTNVIHCSLLEPENFANLHRLTTIAREWAIKQYDTLCDQITADLESQPYESLAASPSAVWHKPEVEEMTRSRSDFNASRQRPSEPL